MASDDDGLVQIHISIWSGDYPVKEVPNTREIDTNRIMLYQNFIWSGMRKKLKNKEYYQLLSEIVFGERNQHISYGLNHPEFVRPTESTQTMDIKSLTYSLITHKILTTIG